MTCCPTLAQDFILWPLDNDEIDGERKLSFNWHTAGIEFDAGKIKEGSVKYYLLEIKEMEKYAFYERDNYHLLVKHMDDNINKDER
ncbi:MAG: hypothetical protein U5K32_00420 [Bacteroidales bacterium]|nr:hypothetical protein [Bacteroidales bacterium]